MNAPSEKESCWHREGVFCHCKCKAEISDLKKKSDGNFASYIRARDSYSALTSWLKMAENALGFIAATKCDCANPDWPLADHSQFCTWRIAKEALSLLRQPLEDDGK